MRRIAGPIVLAVALLVPATADAHVLSKRTARTIAVRAANDICDRWYRCFDATVQSAYRCERRSHHSVECLYMLSLTDGMDCFDTVRISQYTRYGGYHSTFPYPDETVCE